MSSVGVRRGLDYGRTCRRGRSWPYKTGQREQQNQEETEAEAEAKGRILDVEVEKGFVGVFNAVCLEMKRVPDNWKMVERPGREAQGREDRKEGAAAPAPAPVFCVLR